MSHYGILREYRFEEEVDDLRDAEVYGVNDEKLGKIDDVIFNHSTGDIRYVVLDTGGLFSRKKVMVPANRIEPYGSHEDKYYAELDKERLEMLPEFDEKMLAEDYDWSNYEKEYEKRWNDGAVMYNKDTGRIVTPPVEQVEGARRAPLTPEARESLKRDFTPAKMGKEDELLGVASGTGKTTLQPSKISKGGKKDVQEPGKEARPVAPEFATAPEAPSADAPENLREPRIYKVDEPDERHPAQDAQDKDSKDKGPRWASFQNSLRARRDKIVVGCKRCGSQEKAA
ncbi:MAG TPA: PRC-barrel domain-containing protein [Candidatus Angelobacter sp.]|nr:PRC-barrel domain-containing protein [Candidatus Angelobacter sp.]